MGYSACSIAIDNNPFQGADGMGTRAAQKQASTKRLPLILIGVGLLLYLLAAVIHPNDAGVFATMLAVVIIGVVQTVLLVAAAFIVALLIKEGFDEVPTAILRFAAASLFSGGLSAVIPYGGIVALFVFLGLIVWLFDIEMFQAVILTVVYMFISFGVVALLASSVTH